VCPCSICLAGGELFGDDLPNVSFLAWMLGKKGMRSFFVKQADDARDKDLFYRAIQAFETDSWFITTRTGMERGSG